MKENHRENPFKALRHFATGLQKLLGFLSGSLEGVVPGSRRFLFPPAAQHSKQIYQIGTSFQVLGILIQIPAQVLVIARQVRTLEQL
ncbi:MAG: hypothetical protein KatS3mg109_1823 [Pirellulaceae bacterium]|nr:MAG: hypothetical protein KatS3mg109_1823 [Pirellulaceae bacterium]